MTQEERLEYNIRCAEFLGWGFNEISQRWNENMLHDYSFVDNDELKFHSDWNWIMEVLDKIYLLDVYYDEYIEFNSCMFTDGKIKISTKKEAVVEAINQFLIWYKK